MTEDRPFEDAVKAIEACETLNECSVSAVRELAAHLGVDPVGLAERLADGSLVEMVEKANATLERMDRQLRKDDWPVKYRAPWAELTELRAALASLRGDQ